MGRSMDVEKLVKALKGRGLPLPGTKVSVRRKGKTCNAQVLEGSTAMKVKLQTREESFEIPLWKVRPPLTATPEEEQHQQRKSSRPEEEHQKHKRKSSRPEDTLKQRVPERETRIERELKKLDLDPAVLMSLPEDTRAVELRAAWRKKVLESHPDKGGCEEEFREVQNAYDFLVANLTQRE